jgi:peptidoglycan/LPS O-acetylase OafA/YrhL
MTDAARPQERLGFLDVARGLAALLVLLSHAFGHVPGAAALGRAGVVLFLVVSGFIIPASLEQGGSNARFWLRRFFRLFPLYWVSIAVGFGCDLVGLPATPIRTPGDWLLNLTMLQGFVNRPNVWGVFWTLQLELVIYAACSLLFAARLLSRAGWVAGLAVTAYAALGVSRPLLEGKAFALNGTRFLYFAPLVGLVAQRYWAGRLRAGRLAALVLGQVGMVLAIWGVNHALFPAEMTTDCLWELAQTWGVAYAGFFLLLAVRRWPMPAPARWLGRISYSVYLLHPFVLMLLTLTGWPAWLTVPGLVVGTLLLAEVAYRAVEAPGIAAGRAVERRWLPAAQPASVVIPARQAA